MDTFSACVAFGPLAIYLVVLGLINLSRRPLVVAGSRETLALGLAVIGLMLVGPMQLFMPQHAAGRFGEFVWLLLISFYLLCLTLVLIVSRPRLVVYNITPETLRDVLEEVCTKLDPDTTWAGRAVHMPLARVQFQIESFPPLANVSLVGIGDEQSATGWNRLHAALSARLREQPVTAGSHGYWLVLAGLMMLSALTLWVVDDPQMVAQGLNRMLNP